MERRAARISDQILEEASHWFIEFNENEVDHAGRAEFNAWLRRSPECVQAFLQIATFWEDAGACEKWSRIDTEDLIARATRSHNVVRLDSLAYERPIPDHADVAVSAPVAASSSDDDEIAAPNADAVAVRYARKGWLAAAAMVLVVLGAGIVAWYEANLATTYVTGIGERRSIALEDGSMVELNARSRLRVHFTRKQRSIDLLEGQALFDVAKNPDWPFVVTTSDTRVRAVGTQFDVYRKRSGTVVTVVEGRVAVDPNQKGTRDGASSPPLGNSQRAAGAALRLAPREVLLAAGEQMTVTPVNVVPPELVNTEVAIAWTQKKLIFESTPLREVVEEFNRYNRQQLVIRDPELFDFHVSGVFPSTDSTRMVEFLRQRFGVERNSAGDEIEIYRRDAVKPGAQETRTF